MHFAPLHSLPRAALLPRFFSFWGVMLEKKVLHVEPHTLSRFALSLVSGALDA
jgi:hypothetical protein